MTSLIKSFYNWVTSQKNETRVKYPLNPEKVDANIINEALVREVQTLKAQLGKISIERKAEETETKEEEEKQELVDELNTQKVELSEERLGKNPVSLSKFFEFLAKNPKIKDELEVTDRDDKIVFGKFHDLMIGKDNLIILTVKNEEDQNKGDVVATGYSLDQVIYMPETLATQLKRKRIAINRDEKGRNIPDLEGMYLPVMNPIPDADISGDIKYELTTEVKEKAIEIMKNYEEKVRDLIDEKTSLESALGSTRRKVIDLTSAINVYKQNSESSQSELSKALQSTSQYQMKFGELQRQIVILTEQKASMEQVLQRYELINKELLSKLQDWGTKGDNEIVTNKIQELFEWAKVNLPERITINQPPEEKPLLSTPPGQTIQAGRR